MAATQLHRHQIETQITLLVDIWNELAFDKRHRISSPYSWNYDSVAQLFDDATGVYFPVLRKVFDQFTAEINAGERCPSCATSDPTIYYEAGEESALCYSCGSAR